MLSIVPRLRAPWTKEILDRQGWPWKFRGWSCPASFLVRDGFRAEGVPGRA